MGYAVQVAFYSWLGLRSCYVPKNCGPLLSFGKMASTDASLLHPCSVQLKRDGGFSEMQEQVIIKKERMKQELFHLVLFPKFPTNLRNKSEGMQGTIRPSIVNYLISEWQSASSNACALSWCTRAVNFHRADCCKGCSSWVDHIFMLTAVSFPPYLPL